MNGITDSIDMSLSKLWELVINRKAWHAAVHSLAESGTQMSNLSELPTRKDFRREAAGEGLEQRPTHSWGFEEVRTCE